jgi:hypothetical protein
MKQSHLKLADTIVTKDQEIQSLTQQLTDLQSSCKNSEREIQCLLQEKAERLLDVHVLTEAFEKRGMTL